MTAAAIVRMPIRPVWHLAISALASSTWAETSADALSATVELVRGRRVNLPSGSMWGLVMGKASRMGVMMGGLRRNSATDASAAEITDAVRTASLASVQSSAGDSKVPVISARQ